MQGADEHGRLDGHVQGTGDLEPLEGLLFAITADKFHQTGHLPLGELHFLPAEIGQGDIGNLIGQGKIQSFGGHGASIHENDNLERFVIENICRPEPDVLARWLPA